MIDAGLFKPIRFQISEAVEIFCFEKCLEESSECKYWLELVGGLSSSLQTTNELQIKKIRGVLL